jgi:proprotein convertase subtilisin/kexin type 5
VGGNIINCDSSCRSCSGATANDCLSCYGGTALNGGVCSSCSDPYALTCSVTDPSFSLTCARGFTAVMNLTNSPSTSVCEPCAGNCYRCDINGAGTCDPGQCEVGYVQQSGMTNCTQCFNGCPSCDPNNLMTCLSCGVRRYTDGSSNCQACPAGCQNCKSSTSCTSCFPNYVMVGQLCESGPAWPCVSASNGVCTKCVDGFSLSNSSCVYNAICNQNATCSSCPYGYYLTNITNMQGVCAQCPNITNCLACNPLNSTSCFLCDAGFFATTAGACLPCSTGCAQCSSTTYCTLAASGYYLTTTSDNSFSGQTAKCSFPCLTCDMNPNFCLSCVTGYSITGTLCFSNNMAVVAIVFNLPSIFGNNDTFDVAYGKVLNNIGYFRTTICANLPN